MKIVEELDGEESVCNKEKADSHSIAYVMKAMSDERRKSISLVIIC